METNDKRPETEITLNKVLGLIVAVFAVVGVLSLIWAQWRMLQVSATMVFVVALILLHIPENW